MTTRARFTTGIAGQKPGRGVGRFAYGPGTEVRLGRRWSDSEVPKKHAKPWLKSGVLEPVSDDEQD